MQVSTTGSCRGLVVTRTNQPECEIMKTASVSKHRHHPAVSEAIPFVRCSDTSGIHISVFISLIAYLFSYVIYKVIVAKISAQH